jgi:cytochrome c oxidase assembly protein subunit 15
MDAAELWNLAPIAHVAAVGIVVAAGPLAWIWLRHRGGRPGARLRALTLLTLFLTFDLVVFGAFTRLTDSGLGCPDWPGCYGSASPFGAQGEIDAAQTALPSGPVTHGKAWIEMVHRYLATGVGVLITVLALASWLARRRDGRSAVSPWWATATLVWVCVQGAFGALTVTMKLYPAIVTLHLLGGLLLLMLLALQSEGYASTPLRASRALVAGVGGVLALTIVQSALGAWVSTNYAVLACTDFPTCHGSWWPAMDFEHGFALRRELGRGAGGDWLPFAALVAIHYTHRLFAWLVLTALALLAWRLVAAASRDGEPALRRWAAAVAGVAAWQFVTGLSNVVLDWPIVAALAHTGGAAALATLLTVLLIRVAAGRRRAPAAATRGAMPPIEGAVS